MNRRDRIILQKIVEESTVLATMLDGIEESAFLANEEKMRATCMTLLNIGELVKNTALSCKRRKKGVQCALSFVLILCQCHEPSAFAFRRLFVRVILVCVGAGAGG